MAKKKISYAKTSTLDPDEFDSAHVKVLISIRLDAEVLDAVKADAIKKGEKYQRLINQILREHYLGKRLTILEDKALETKIREIAREELKKAI